MLTATQEAKVQVATILERNPGMAFRVSIKGGGCSGFKYDFDLTKREDDDIVIAENGDYAIVTDPLSHMYLDGAVLNFKDDIFSKTFVLENPNVKTTCGCGESFGV